MRPSLLCCIGKLFFSISIIVTLTTSIFTSTSIYISCACIDNSVSIYLHLDFNLSISMSPSSCNLSVMVGCPGHLPASTPCGTNTLGSVSWSTWRPEVSLKTAPRHSLLYYPHTFISVSSATFIYNLHHINIMTIATTMPTTIYIY